MYVFWVPGQSVVTIRPFLGMKTLPGHLGGRARSQAAGALAAPSLCISVPFYKVRGQHIQDPLSLRGAQPLHLYSTCITKR